MNAENTTKLYQAFPRLYRGREKPVNESLMSWGFACGDGWFHLVWQLSKAIEEIARKEGLNRQSEAWPEAIQVKEKFRTLRFRIAHWVAFYDRNETYKTVIEEALAASEHTCEACGAKNTVSKFPD